MKRVLIVDNEEAIIFTLTEALKPYADRLNLVTAFDGQEALDQLTAQEVNLVVTDLYMPGMDGFELLARMAADYPLIPVIVMTGFTSPETTIKLKRFSSIRVIEKPIDLDVFVHHLLESLELSDQGGSVSGISLSNFLQLIEMEQKTCLLEIHAAGTAAGLIYFQNGELWDGICAGLHGEQAVLKILAWQRVKINFRTLPQRRIRRRIETPLMALVLESARRRDEAGAPIKPAVNELFELRESAQALENRSGKRGPVGLEPKPGTTQGGRLAKGPESMRSAGAGIHGRSSGRQPGVDDPLAQPSSVADSGLTMGVIPQLLFSLRLRRIIRPHQSNVSLDPTMINVLVAVDERKTIAQMADELGIDVARLSPALSRLLQLGLVEVLTHAPSYVERRLFDELKSRFIEIVGPVGPVLIENTLQDMGIEMNNVPANRAEELIAQLSEEIPNATERERFQSNMRRLLLPSA